MEEVCLEHSAGEYQRGEGGGDVRNCRGAASLSRGTLGTKLYRFRRSGALFQAPAHGLLNDDVVIVEEVGNEIPGITPQRGQIGLVPAALGHVWRQSTQEPEAAAYF